MGVVFAVSDGTTEAETKERARIAQIANDSLLVSRAPGSSASLSVAAPDHTSVASVFAPGRRVRVILDGSASETALRQGSASVQFTVDRLHVKEGRKTLSELITAKRGI